MDAGDRDLGSVGVVILDPTVFNGTGVNRIAIAAGKSGIVYVLNADSLGCFKQGIGGTDGGIQTLNIPDAGSIFGGPGSYPLEAGYVYFAPVGFAFYCLGFSRDAYGIHSSALLAIRRRLILGDRESVWYVQGPSSLSTLSEPSPRTTSSALGSQIFSLTGFLTSFQPAVDRYRGKPGTCIVWLTEAGVGLKAWSAVPVNGVLIPLNAPLLAAAGKYIRAVFGNFTLCNLASSGSQMAITQSSAASGIKIFTESLNTELTVGSKIFIGNCAIARVEVAGPWSNPNRLAQNAPSIWSVSTDGTNVDGTPFVQSVAISATVTSPEFGVIFPNGTAVYQYLGCYFDGAGRQFSNQLSYNVKAPSFS